MLGLIAVEHVVAVMALQLDLFDEDELRAPSAQR